MAVDQGRLLSDADKEEVLRRATGRLLHRYAGAIKRSNSDAALETARAEVLGIFGGSGGPDLLSVIFTGTGLCIWGGWHIVNHGTERPLSSGKKTIAMAREVNRIANPENPQFFPL